MPELMNPIASLWGERERDRGGGGCCVCVKHVVVSVNRLQSAAIGTDAIEHIKLRVLILFCPVLPTCPERPVA